MLNIQIIIWFVFFSIVFGSYDSDIYPSDVPIYEIRSDYYTNKTVTSGWLHNLKFKSTLADFKRYLQCPLVEPNFNYNSGVISALKLSPLSKDTLKTMCGFIETGHYNWQQGVQYSNDADQGKYRTDEKFNELNSYSNAYMLRVTKGVLFYDWPWGIKRFVEKKNSNTIVPLMAMTLTRLIDIKDSVFFVGGDQPSISIDTPMPIFAHSTAESFTDIVWPWYEMWQDANQAYKFMRKVKYDFTEHNYQRVERGYRHWKARIPKAAFFGALFRNRQFMFDLARAHPDLFDARFTTQFGIAPWNPSSTEIKSEPGVTVTVNASAPIGYVSSVANISVDNKFSTYFPGAYKYVIVPLGYGSGLSTSSRLQHLLSFSGAVILMQRSSFKFHVSAQLLPWVHYVPVSFSGSDVIEKVQWLREHDDFAQRIAQNGRNFARSYLRLEDYYCYAAAALDTMAELSSLSSDVTKKMFNPRRIQPFAIRFEDTEAFKWPS